MCGKMNRHKKGVLESKRRLAQHTRTSPDGETKNQTDFVLVDKRFRNGVKNSKVMPAAQCESDHNLVIATIKTRIQNLKKSKKTVKLNINSLKKADIRHTFRSRLDKQIEEKGSRDMKKLMQSGT